MQEEPPGWYETWWFWTAAGVIVAGAVVGTVYALQPKDQHENSDVHVSVLGGGTP
jgi:predicted membrane channel-forming protein YqfA (hemolysin III family)